MKTPLVLQQEATECGLACIATVLNHFGSRVNLKQLRLQFDLSIRGTSLLDLVKIAQQLKLESITYILKAEQVDTLQIPAILHCNSNHYVVLYKIDKRKGYYILDPAKGGYWITQEDFKKIFSSFAISLKPKINYTPFKGSHLGIYHLLFNELPSIFWYASSIVMLSLLLQLAILSFPAFIQKLIIPVEAVTNWNSDSTIKFTVLILILSKVCESLLYFMRGLTISFLQQIITANLGKYIFKHLMNLPLSYFEKRSQSTILNRFNSIDKIKETLSRGFAEGLIDGFFSLVTLFILFIYNIHLGLWIIILSSIYLFLNYCLGGLAQEINIAQIHARSKEVSVFLECVRGIVPIKVASSENKGFRKWLNHYLNYLSVSKKINILQASLESLNILLFGIKITGVIYIGVRLMTIGRITLGDLYAVLFYLNSYIKNISGITSKWFDVKLCISHVKNLADIVLYKIEPVNLNSKQTINDYVIRLDNISFRYHENSHWILTNFNLTISAGSCIVLCGPSGSGKTTLLKILMGLIKPTQGCIYLNNTLINEENIRWYRSKLAGVMQSDELFVGTINENISFFDEVIDYDHVMQSAKLAGIHNEISDMPMGYYSYLGDMGVAISGGQKQRILLARALYKKPSLLVLDEAFSNLDIPTEATLNNALSSLKMTRIIITHRTESLAFADRVIDIRAFSPKYNSFN